MISTKCTQCGYGLSGKERFCPKCGRAVPEEERQPAPVPEQPKETDVSLTVTEQPRPKKDRKKMTALSVVLSVLLCALIIALGTSASLLGIVRLSLGDTAIETMVENVEIGELRTGELSGSGKQSETLPDMIYDSILPEFKQYLPERGEAVQAIEDFLEEDFVREFVADEMEDYASDLLTGSNDSKIEVDEVMELIRDHREELEGLTQGGYHITSQDLDDVETYLKENEILDDLEFSKLRRENRTAFDLLQGLCSYWMLGILAGACVLFIVFLFLVNRRFRRTMVYLGSSLFIIGTADCVLGIMTVRFSEMLNQAFPLGNALYTALLSPVQMYSLIAGICIALAGLLAVILPQVLRKRQRP